MKESHTAALRMIDDAPLDSQVYFQGILCNLVGEGSLSDNESPKLVTFSQVATALDVTEDVVRDWTRGCMFPTQDIRMRVLDFIRDQIAMQAHA